MLFGIYRLPDEGTSVSISGWMEGDYALLALGNVLGFAAGNVVGENLVKALGDKVDARVVGSLGKIATSAVFYVVSRKAKPELRLVGVGMSLGAITSLVIDVVQYLTKGKASEFGLPPASWYMVASYSASYASSEQHVA